MPSQRNNESNGGTEQSRKRMHAFNRWSTAHPHTSGEGMDHERVFALLTQVITSRFRLNRQLVELGIKMEGKKSRLGHMLDRLSLRFSLILWRLMHAILTLVCWQHFFYIKFRQQEANVPDGAPNEGLKRFTPPFEFGAMHAILFQLALVPLTMCRSTLAWLSTSSPLRGVFPFEHILQFHIFVGYLFCLIMVLSVIFFFIFFGKVCSDHLNGRDPADLCRNFSREIMFTGYGILVATLVILSSSFFRARLAYEVFYYLHIFFVFAMFTLAILHTLDDEFRAGTPKGKARSQAWRWFATSLVTYLADRMWSYTSMRRATVLKAELSYDEQTIVLYVRKPAGFVFSAGQHASLQIPSIDATWHPFSIGSAPSAPELVFFIRVCTAGSWTQRLSEHTQLERLVTQRAAVNILGPYGYPMCGGGSHDRVLAVGTGTGIVPLFSLMWERARRLGMLQKDVLLETREQRTFEALVVAKKEQQELQKAGGARKGGPLGIAGASTVISVAGAALARRLPSRRARCGSAPVASALATSSESSLSRGLPPTRLHQANGANGGQSAVSSTASLFSAGAPLPSSATCPPPTSSSPRASRTSLSRNSVLHGDGHMTIEPDEDAHLERQRQVVADLVVARAQLRWRARRLSRALAKGEHAATRAHGQIARVARRVAVTEWVTKLTLCVVLAEVAFVPLGVSWANYPAHAPAIPIQAALLKWQTLGAVAYFVAHRLYLLGFALQGYRRPIMLVTFDALVCGLMLIFVVRLFQLGSFRIDPAVESGLALTQAQQALLLIFGAYRVVRLTQAAASVGGTHAPILTDTESAQLLGQEKFTLIWVTRSADLLIGYLPELDAMLEVLSRTLYLGDQNASIGETLQLKIFCTERDPALVAEARRQIAMHHLRENVVFERPDLSELIVHYMGEEIIHSQDANMYHNTLLTFCGSPAVATACLHGCARANSLAARLGHAQRIEFREEYYGHGAGGTPRSKSKPKAVAAAETALPKGVA